MENTTLNRDSSSRHLMLDDGSSLEELKEMLVRLLSSSTIVDARVWLDGVYTSLQNLELHLGSGHELYYKIEGKLDSRNTHR